jgi:hypothetical protein
MTEFRVGRIFRNDGKPVTLPDAILADKQTMRVSVMMRDGETNGPCSDCGGSGLYPASVRCPTCGGTGIDPANTASDRASLSDAKMRDHMAKDEAWRQATQAHRAGFRIDSSPEGRAARQKTFDAMAQYDDEREAAYKTLASEFTASDPSSRMNIGAGSPSKKFGRVQEGDVCTTSAGQPGRIAANGECVASHEDRRTVVDIARDHATRMDAEYQNYETQIGSAYRTLK